MFNLHEFFFFWFSSLLTEAHIIKYEEVKFEIRTLTPFINYPMSLSTKLNSQRQFDFSIRKFTLPCIMVTFF